MWHPRMDADPAHRWLRDTVTAVCLAAASSHKRGPAPGADGRPRDTDGEGPA